MAIFSKGREIYLFYIKKNKLPLVTEQGLEQQSRRLGGSAVPPPSLRRPARPRLRAQTFLLFPMPGALCSGTPH